MFLTVDRQVFAVWLTGFEAVEEIVLPTRIKCRHKPLDRAQQTEDKGVNAPPEAILTACYKDGKTKLRILCGSV